MLETIWFVLWGVLWAVYLALDGYDFGIGMLLPFLGRTEEDRRLIINSMGPFWDGNEVWLITAGGVTFAAFPKTYAVMFSALYAPLMLLLFSLILRGVSFEFRSKVDHPAWRRLWDTTLFIGSFAPALLLGVFFANLFCGVPIDGEGILQGTILDLLHPYGLLGGILFVSLFLVHGALWLSIMTANELQAKALHIARAFWPVSLVAVVLVLMVSTFRTDLFANYLNNPALFLVLLVAVAGFVLTRVSLAKVFKATDETSRKKLLWLTWTFSAVAIIFTAAFGVVGMYPNLLISSINPMYNLTAFNSASSPLTLKIMLGIALVMVPIVIAYQTWVHLKFGKTLSIHELEEGSNSY